MAPDGDRGEPRRRRQPRQTGSSNRLTWLGTVAIVSFGIVCFVAGESEAAPSLSIHRGYNKRNGHQNYAETDNIEDEDVLELEHLKHVRPQAATDDAALERELAIASESAMSGGGNGGRINLNGAPNVPRLAANKVQPQDDAGKAKHQPDQQPGGEEAAAALEEEEDADEIALNAAAGAMGSDTKPTPKTYHGAARLAFGQNPEPVVSSLPNNASATTTTEHTDSPTAASQTPAINPTQTDAQPPPSAAPPISDAIRADELAAFEEFTHNGQRRSLSGVSKDPEMLLMRHSGGQVSSLDMAQYVYWTGDEEGVARAVEEFIQKGLMSREDAIKLLREISLGIEYLENSFSNSVKQNYNRASMADNSIDQSSGRSLMKRKSNPSPTRPAKSARFNTLSTTITTPAASTPTVAATTTLMATTTAKPTVTSATSRVEEEPSVSPSLQKEGAINVPLFNTFNDMLSKRSPDQDIRDNSLGYMEISEKLRLADSLYAAYSLEETIYQLAKVMFFQSLSTGSQQGAVALQRLTAFLEAESAHGRVSPVLQKRIIDVLLAALSDCLAEHPDLIPAAREGLGAALDQLPKTRLVRNQLVDSGAFH